MELCFILLKEENKLDKLVKKLSESGFKNVIILNADSHSEYEKNNGSSIFNSLRYMIDSFNDESRLVLVISDSAEVSEIGKIASNVASKEEYLFFSFPINNVEGFIK